MSENYPIPADRVLAILIEIFQHQHQAEVVDLLGNSVARIDEVNYDNWNGGTSTWALSLEVPVALFASAEPRLSAIKKEITKKLHSAFHERYTNDFLDAVVITPAVIGATVFSQWVQPPEHEASRLWHEGLFRLFLSHISKHKAKVAILKKQFLLRGVDAFVAHEDIEPSLPWQGEIELALRSMYAIVALVTPGFHESNWTDQEVGWALGRGVLVLPVRLNTDPYGFVGKTQAISGDLDEPAGLAESVVRCLLANPRTHGEMRRGLVRAFSNPPTYEAAKVLQKHLSSIEDFTADEKTSLYNACAEDSQVKGAWGVVNAIYRRIGQPPEPSAADTNDISF